MTYNIQNQNDNVAYSTLTRTNPDACVHGTAFRISKRDNAVYGKFWADKYVKIPISLISTKTGRHLAATTLHLATPPVDPAQETAPTDDIVKKVYCQMIKREY